MVNRSFMLKLNIYSREQFTNYRIARIVSSRAINVVARQNAWAYVNLLYEERIFGAKNGRRNRICDPFYVYNLKVCP